MKQWIPGLLFSMILIAGCGTAPFQRADVVSLEDADPLAIVGHYRKSLPEHFRLLNTVLYKYGWNKFSAIGYIDIDTKARTFIVVNLTPMGLKLFELTGDDRGVNAMFMIDQVTNKDGFAKSVGEDIRRIYFDLVPSDSAEIEKGKHEIKFRQRSGRGFLEYIFAGTDGYLIRKDYYEGNRLRWRVSYYEYRKKQGKIYPGGIILNNYQYGYSLTVKLKEIQS